MPGLIKSSFGVAVVAGLIGFSSLSSAQVVRGGVIDAETKGPLRNVDARLLGARDSLLKAMLVNDEGKFFLVAPADGQYSLHLRRLGYMEAITKPFRLAAGDTITLTVELARLVITLDTVRADVSRNVLSRTTPGREFLARHFREGKGVFVSGWQMEKSGLTVSQYLGEVDGLTLTGTRNPGMPVIPAGGGNFITSTYPSRCLYARVDHVSLAYLLMVKKAQTLDDVLKVEHIMGVEVYRDRNEIPAEWKYAGFVQNLFYRRNADVEYLLGDTGAPLIAQTLVESDSLAFETRTATRNLLTDTRTVMASRGGEGVVGGVGGGGADSLSGGGVGAPPVQSDSVRGYMMGKPSGLVTRENIMIPQCGFLQIWTKTAW